VGLPGSDLAINVSRWLGYVLQMTGQYDEALESYGRACDALAPQTSHDLKRWDQFAGLCARIATVYEKTSQHDLALDRLDDGLRALDGAETIEAVRLYLVGAGIFYRQGNSAQALDWCGSSLEILSRLEGLDRAERQMEAHACYLQGARYVRGGDHP
jgi:tetratricopeptide (TPR) repeat protein